MNRYAKIKATSNNKSKSRSMEFSADLQSFSTTQKSIQHHETTHHTQSPETKSDSNQISKNCDFDDDHQEQGNGFDVKLTRSSSVSSNAAYHQMFGLERSGSRKVKRAFSVRRSSSVSEKYCKIHDQCDTLPSPTFDDADMDNHNNAGEKINNTVKIKSGKFLRVCKRFLRL